MPVILYKSVSQKVQDFVNAWLAVNNNKLFMIDVASKQIISTDLIDVPLLGFSTKSHLERSLGFPEQEPSEEKEGARIFDIEAALYLEVNRQTLPAELQALKGELWLIDIEKEEFLPVIKPLADALSEEFKIDIVIRPEAAKDNDPKHVTERLGNGVLYCPIIPRIVGPQTEV